MLEGSCVTKYYLINLQKKCIKYIEWIIRHRIVICGLSLLLVLRPCSEKFFFGYNGFPLPSKTHISKFQFDLNYCQALYHEPLAREIAQALSVLLHTLFFTTWLTSDKLLSWVPAVNCFCLLFLRLTTFSELFAPFHRRQLWVWC